ncbi:SDR family NAD(P)-dependent oxidoreductase [Amycolatopsis sp. cmx-11-12]|uniref:SDR family NAD(P)-dependent oxidoreductase n=1 Tax=Amycolatopsis sp. cmx-11-12 TaxID=2785795 RepID=UPI0039180CBD
MRPTRGSDQGSGVVITGGGTGIGRATARAFADSGADVLIVGRSESTLAETAAGCRRIRYLVTDISEPDAPEKIVNFAQREVGRIDVLVNNAVVISPAVLGEIDRAATEKQIATTLYAPLFLTQCALPALEASGGTVVNISTAGSLGRRGWRGMSVYGAGKVALDFLTRTWAVELAPRGIRVVAIAPGVIDTGIGERMGWSPEENARHLEQRRASIPAGRTGRPEEIAWWIMQLTKPEAGYASGIVLPLDGAAFLS